MPLACKIIDNTKVEYSELGNGVYKLVRVSSLTKDCQHRARCPTCYTKVELHLRLRGHAYYKHSYSRLWGARKEEVENVIVEQSEKPHDAKNLQRDN